MWANAQRDGRQYTLCSEKNPLLFSFMTSSQINQYAQKFQHS